MADREWLQGLQEGDEVAVSIRGLPAHIARVVRTTATQVVVREGEHEVRYLKSTGGRVGEHAYEQNFRRLEPSTVEVKAQIVERRRRQRALRTLESTEWKKLTTEQLVELAGRVESFLKEPSPPVPEEPVQGLDLRPRGR